MVPMKSNDVDSYKSIRGERALLVYGEHLLEYVNTVELWTREGIEGGEVVLTHT